MTDRRVLARLRITPCGLYDPVNHTISLQQIGSDYFLEVFERNGLTRKQVRWRVAISEAVVQDRLAVLKKATIPAFPISPQVCDGEYVELTVEGECSTLTLGWWTLPPRGARRFAEFADWLRDEGRGYAESKEDQNG